jgi:hypothetical protein
MHRGVTGTNIAVLRNSAIAMVFTDIEQLNSASGGNNLMTKTASFGWTFTSPSTKEQL